MRTNCTSRCSMSYSIVLCAQFVLYMYRALCTSVCARCFSVCTYVWTVCIRTSFGPSLHSVQVDCDGNVMVFMTLCSCSPSVSLFFCFLWPKPVRNQSRARTGAGERLSHRPRYVRALTPHQLFVSVSSRSPFGPLRVAD